MAALEQLDLPDSEDELPPCWEERLTQEGRVYYVNHVSGTTQWNHPFTEKESLAVGALPRGWAETINNQGVFVYTNISTGQDSFTDPRIVNKRAHAVTLSPTFDSSTHATEVLRGKDVSSHYFIITGASSGIGKAVALALAASGANLVLGIHSLATRESLLREFNQAGAKSVFLFELRLESLRSVLNFAKEYIASGRPLHALIINAATHQPPTTATEDGCDITFQVNYLSNVLLVRLLEPVLVTSQPSRIVFVTCESHRVARPTADELTSFINCGGKGEHPLHAYNMSKLLQVLLASALNVRYSRYSKSSSGVDDQPVFVNSIHPGNIIATNLARHSWLMWALVNIARPFTSSVEQAAAGIVYLAAHHSTAMMGGYYWQGCVVCDPSDEAQNPALQDICWELSNKLIDRIFGSLF